MNDLPSRVKVRGWDGVALTVLEERDGQWLVHMVGDDRTYLVDPEECTPLDADDFCPSCGQTRCGHR
jgi:hypothetical protein